MLCCGQSSAKDCRPAARQSAAPLTIMSEWPVSNEEDAAAMVVPSVARPRRGESSPNVSGARHMSRRRPSGFCPTGCAQIAARGADLSFSSAFDLPLGGSALLVMSAPKM